MSCLSEPQLAGQETRHVFFFAGQAAGRHDMFFISRGQPAWRHDMFFISRLGIQISRIRKECLSIWNRPCRIWSAEDSTCFLFRVGPNKKHVVSQSRQGQATRRLDMFFFSRTRQIIINTTCYFGPPNKKHVVSEIKNMSCLEPWF